MPTDTPHDRVRASIALTVAIAMADRLVQYDKANPAFKLSDLRDDDERAIYIDAVMNLMTPTRRQARAILLNSTRAHGFAHREADQQDVDRQAREDVARFSRRVDDVPRFGVMRPGYCHVCHEAVITDRVVLLITPNLQTEAHGLCCAKDDNRFELIAEFAYRIKPEAR